MNSNNSNPSQPTNFRRYMTIFGQTLLFLLVAACGTGADPSHGGPDMSGISPSPQSPSQASSQFSLTHFNLGGEPFATQDDANAAAHHIWDSAGNVDFIKLSQLSGQNMKQMLVAFESPDSPYSPQLWQEPPYNQSQGEPMGAFFITAFRTSRFVEVYCYGQTLPTPDHMFVFADLREIAANGDETASKTAPTVRVFWDYNPSDAAATFLQDYEEASPYTNVIYPVEAQ